MVHRRSIYLCLALRSDVACPGVCYCHASHPYATRVHLSLPHVMLAHEPCTRATRQLRLLSLSISFMWPLPLCCTPAGTLVPHTSPIRSRSSASPVLLRLLVAHVLLPHAAPRHGPQSVADVLLCTMVLRVVIVEAACQCC